MKMTKMRNLLLWTAMAALLSQSLAMAAVASANFDDQKTYYSPDPRARTPPAAPRIPPPTPASGGGHATPTPSHGTPSVCGTPPPRGGHHHHRRRPTTPTTPSRPGGSGYYRPPPTPTPTRPTTPTPIVYPPPTVVTPAPARPTTPTPSRPGGGGYYRPPSTPTPIVYPPPTVVTPTPARPTTPTPITYPPPTTPIVVPVAPTTPGITVPSPPFPFDPNSPPFTCNYWRNHPTIIWGLVGWFGTIGNAFGVSSLPGFGSNMNLLQALSNTRTDGYGELYREGTAALLNSMSSSRFPYTYNQVRASFVAALGSNKAAAAQAQLFKLANEGRTKSRA